MKQRDEALVSNELVESILLGIGSTAQPELLQLYTGCGYQVEARTMFYPAASVRCMIERVAAHLYPDQPHELALQQIGARMVAGHSRTFDAQLWAAKAIQMSQDEAFESILTYFRTVPAARPRLTRYGSHHYGLRLTGWPLQPEIVVGSFCAIITGISNNEVQAGFVASPEPDSYDFTFQWQRSGAGLPAARSEQPTNRLDGWLLR